MLDHWGSGRTSLTEHGSKGASHHPRKEIEDSLTPISNWAHLSYVKNQRNTLRTELMGQCIAGAEARRSVSSLRRLAFRMAVNISVKEKQFVTSAKYLANSRNASYLEGKDAEKKVDALKRALRVEERKNIEVIEALERASVLTLQCEFARPIIGMC